VQVRVEYLGKKVKCQHCGAAFYARDPADTSQPADLSDSNIARADELLAALKAEMAQRRR
jgi:hypothetical protein